MVPNLTLYEMLSRAVEQAPNRIAVHFDEEAISYRDLLNSVNKLGHYLQNKGVTAGDRVIMVLQNSPAFIYSYFAITGIGAIVVPVNPVWTAEEISFIIENSQAKAIIGVPSPAVKAVADKVDLVLWAGGAEGANWQEAWANAGTSPLPGPASENDLGVFIYTSGTTGKPKGAMLSHRNLTADVFATVEALKARHGGEVFLCVLPLFHCLAATVCMLMPIGLCAEIVLMEQFVPKLVVDNLRRHKVSVIVGVPAMYVVMTTSNMPSDAFSNARICISGGAPLPISILQRFEQTYGLPIREGYGLSEASPVVTINVPEKIKPGTIGPPIPGVSVRVIDPSGKDLAQGEAGELLVKGPNVMVGYFGMPEATTAALRDGWLYTGDIATIDEDGYVTIVDRLKDMIIVGGLKVYPREVEEVLYTHPKIKEAAVVGIKHALRGESVKAVVSLKDGQTMTPQDVISFCKEHLANYKVPKVVEFQEALPKSSTGKILRRLLVTPASATAEIAEA